MKKKLKKLLTSLFVALVLLGQVHSTSYAAATETVLANTKLGDANYVNPEWMNYRVYMTGYGINCSMGIGEMASYPVQIKQVGNEKICVLMKTTLVDAFIANMNNDLKAQAKVQHKELVGTGSAKVSTETTSYMQIGPNMKNWLLGILHKRLMEAPGDIHLTLTEDMVVLVTKNTPVTNTVGGDYVVAGTCTTSYKTSSQNRCTNIEVASSRMNLVIMPGQTVSVSDTFLPRTEANGYKVAHAYSNGQIVDSLGGGICQVSSTIYNACRNSGLEIIQRHPHSMPVSYLPLGMDAAISAGTKDLVFRNPYDTPVIMQASTQDKTVTISVLVSAKTLGGRSYKFWAQKTGPLSADSYVTTYQNGVEVSTVGVGTSKYRSLPQ